MNMPYTRAPHQGAGFAGPESSHAALLIDFDNVTMGMRSDLSKELKSLLDTDVIKGKVSVQRAYADWRRYPQYIVPLSEASVDLIYAPAYGSNKKNATDIRMAIDALELVFIRPEIATYILLTGDSDFSSLVLKLKEYGKYVIGVGIQESSSDILVQNCDEYYSYTSLTGLTKTTELNRDSRDPWVLVKDAVAKMVQRGDVMRSDRLKQVMQEMDPTFDEKSIGFSKFSKFLAEASSRGLVRLRKLENGQYEIEGGKASSRSEEGRGRRDRGRGRRGGRSRGSSRESQREAPRAGDGASSPEGGDPMAAAYSTLREALTALREAGREPARDSDVKRKILSLHRGFDEAELGFPKFSRFLEQAEADRVVRLERSEAGNLDVTMLEEETIEATTEAPEEAFVETPASATGDEVATPDETPATEAESQAAVVDVEPPKRGIFGLRLGPRRGSTRRRGDEGGSSFFGLVTGSTPSDPTPTKSDSTESETDDSPKGTGVAATGDFVDVEESADPDLYDLRTDEDAVEYGEDDDVEEEGARVETSSTPLEGLGLPSDPGAIARYLTHRYKGVGEKTAEALVDALGADVFQAMHERPEEIARIVPQRADQVLEAWRSDYERRSGLSKGGASSGGRRGGRSRGRRGRS